MKMTDAELKNRVEARTYEPVYMTGKSDIIEYYKDKYGQKNWTQHAATALAGTSDKKSKEYSRAIRQFQGKRLEQSGKTLAPKFASVGKSLPPIGKKPPKNGIKIKFQGHYKISARWHKTSKPIEVTLRGTDVLDPTFYGMFDEYLKDVGGGGQVEDYDVSGLQIEAA